MQANTPARPTAASGFAAAVTAFLIWGLFPLYLKPLAAVPAPEIMAHRIVWCCLLVFGWLAVRGELGLVRAALADPVSRLRLAGSATLISINWLIYVWAVGNGHVVDASLGYFINPLLNVVLGVLVLKERLNRAQWFAVGLAGLGVLYLAIVAGRPPWIALSLAASFGMYGLIRKVVAVDAVPGLATETLLLAPFAAAFLVWSEMHGSGALGHASLQVSVLLVGSGLATALPLALFAYGARMIPLSTVGLVQYIGPTLQFLIGVLVFHEPFTRARAIGFVVIWTALAIYAADSLWRSRGAGGPRGIRLQCGPPPLRAERDTMAVLKVSSRADRLLEHHRLRGRAYPAPRYWERLFQSLEEEAEKRGKTPPPPPITHGLEHEPTDQDRMDRLREQVAWADRNNLLHRIQMFFDAMPSSGWVRLEK